VRSRTAIAVLGLLALACSPELDWRELRSAEGGFAALMPSRPGHEVRRLGDAATMHLWSARAANSVFGVGYIDYKTLNDGILDTTRDALVRNIGGRLVGERSLVQAGLTGRGFEARSGERLLRARLLVSGSRLYQIAILGNNGAVAPADAELFLSSFVPLPPGRPG